MELILTRIAKRKTYTIGRLAIINKVSEEYMTYEQEEYFCDTLEPTWRDYKHGGRKIKGCSAIPEGRYAVVIAYSPQFEQWLPILLGVPMFRGIRIHAGRSISDRLPLGSAASLVEEPEERKNTSNDTEGCILVGRNKLVGQLVDSRIWLHRLKQKIVEAKERGEPVWITIR